MSVDTIETWITLPHVLCIAGIVIALRIRALWRVYMKGQRR